VQDYQAQGPRYGYLRKSQAQAEAGLIVALTMLQVRLRRKQYTERHTLQERLQIAIDSSGVSLSICV
jgi:hypothetical protein